MGADSSRIDVKRMPSYFIEQPDLSLNTSGIIQRSLRNMIGNVHIEGSRNRRSAFIDFYDRFYERINEEKDEDIQVTMYLDEGLAPKSLFLVKLLKLLVTIPQNMLVNKKSKKYTTKLDTLSRRLIKKFVREYRDIKVDCYGPIGEALFQGIKIDEMYTVHVHEAWRNAYSLLLRHLLPFALQFRATKRFATDSDYDLRSDVSSGGESEEEDLRSRRGTAGRRFSLLRKLAQKRMQTQGKSAALKTRFVHRYLRDIYDIADPPKTPKAPTARRHSFSSASGSTSPGSRSSKSSQKKFWDNYPSPKLGQKKAHSFDKDVGAPTSLSDMPEIGEGDEDLPNGLSIFGGHLGAPNTTPRRFSAELEADVQRAASQYKTKRNKRHARQHTFSAGEFQTASKEKIFHSSPLHGRKNRDSPRKGLRPKKRRVIVRRASAPSVLESVLSSGGGTKCKT